jgi:hypothetical protein
MAGPNVSSRLSTVVGPQPGPERALGQQFSGVTGQAPEQGQPVAGIAPQQPHTTVDRRSLELTRTPRRRFDEAAK